ncbi:hypothetical protein E4U13_001163 [Claviceps humidiphila]|uniref:Rrn9 domain-containing protein n=1 Tax=Claviceps humidiphila TaxID=1294629 RepID=A0A9P7Q0P0_9HYPO|nr:hypothetical protein E4U13_001163 [Claviceps humidiphila]
MASSPEPPTAARRQWEELDSDDIASVMSEDLYEYRPNRWTGPRSTWRALVREERMLWRSMQQVVDQDLAVHLYNAFALKRRDLDARTAQGLTMKLANGQEVLWAPPKVWTAWPLHERQVPSEGLFKEADDEAEAFTLRRQEKKLPSSELQEELGATILRMAKERFQRRQKQRQQRQQEREQRQRERLRRQQQMSRSSSIAPSIETPSRPVSLKFEESEDETFLSSLPPGRTGSSDDDEKVKLSWTSDDEYNNDDDDGGQEGNEGSQPDPESPTQDYEPAVATDDQLSQQLLRPSIRHILTQLDRTLTALHNSRVAGQIHIFDSSDSSMEDDSDAAPARGRGRPRRMPQPGSRDTPPAAAAAAAAAAKTAASPQRRRGRPLKVRVPLEGETFEEMQFRLARESHRRLPVTEKDKEAAFLAWLEEGDQQMLREAQSQNQESPPPSQEQEPEPASPSSSFHGGASPPSQPGNMQRRLRKWGLRDWSDVLGAASLAGFSPDVIARSTRRCANLFNQGMTMRTLNEQPLSRGPGLTTTEFRPKPVATTKTRGRGQGLGNSVSPSSAAAPVSTDSDSDGDIDSESDTSHETLRSRKRVFSRSSVPLDSSPIRSRGRSRTCRSPSGSAASNAHSRSRSRSRSSAGLFLCAVPTCSRAVGGFARRLNLRRHMQLVHPGYAEEEDDSDNEVVGAVHVDGFLKMIHPGKGWRAEDVLPRKRKRYYGRGGSRDG